MPAWRHFNDTLLYAARNTLVGKMGVPKVDLAFYAADEPFGRKNLYSGGTVLRAAGVSLSFSIQ